MNILVTGFDPFGGEETNPSWEAVKRLPDTIQGAEVRKLQLPTIFSQAAAKVQAELEKEEVDVVLSVGQAGGRAAMTPELIGINYMQARIPDNAGEQPNGAIVEGGEDGLFSTLPVEKIVEELKNANIPAELSFSAGSFVCNHVLYSTLHYIRKQGIKTRAGFIHVPFLPEQAAKQKRASASMSLEQIVRGLEIAIKTTIDLHSQ